MSPPTEATILTNFLLPSAALPSIIPLKQFTALFPRAHQQSSPQRIKRLYRDLQHQRARVTDGIARNVAGELKRGAAERREVLRVRRLAGREEERDGDEEIEVEEVLNHGQTSNLPASRPHTLKSIVPELESAVGDLEEEVRRDREEAEALLEEMRSVVGELSDLRYGRLANGDLREQVLEGLARLEGSCDDLS